MVKDEPAFAAHLAPDTRGNVVRMAKAMCRQSAIEDGEPVCSCGTDGGSCVAFGLYGGLAHAAFVLEAELQERLWVLFDAAKALGESDSAERWEALHRAVANVPESRRHSRKAPT